MPRTAIASAIKRTRLENAGNDPTVAAQQRPNTEEAQEDQHPDEGKTGYPDETPSSLGETRGEWGETDSEPVRRKAKRRAPSKKK